MCYLDVLEHVRVVANLPQLHDSVHQGLRATFTLKSEKTRRLNVDKIKFHRSHLREFVFLPSCLFLTRL